MSNDQCKTIQISLSGQELSSVISNAYFLTPQKAIKYYTSIPTRCCYLKIQKEGEKTTKPQQQTYVNRLPWRSEPAATTALVSQL